MRAVLHLLLRLLPFGCIQRELRTPRSLDADAAGAAAQRRMVGVDHAQEAPDEVQGVHEAPAQARYVDGGARERHSGPHTHTFTLHIVLGALSYTLFYAAASRLEAEV